MCPPLCTTFAQLSPFRNSDPGSHSRHSSPLPDTVPREAATTLLSCLDLAAVDISVWWCSLACCSSYLPVWGKVEKRLKSRLGSIRAASNIYTVRAAARIPSVQGIFRCHGWSSCHLQMYLHHYVLHHFVLQDNKRTIRFTTRSLSKKTKPSGVSLSLHHCPLYRKSSTAEGGAPIHVHDRLPL